MDNTNGNPKPTANILPSTTMASDDANAELLIFDDMVVDDTPDSPHVFNDPLLTNDVISDDFEINLNEENEDLIYDEAELEAFLASIDEEQNPSSVPEDNSTTVASVLTLATVADANNTDQKDKDKQNTTTLPSSEKNGVNKNGVNDKEDKYKKEDKVFADIPASSIPASSIPAPSLPLSFAEQPVLIEDSEDVADDDHLNDTVSNLNTVNTNIDYLKTDTHIDMDIEMGIDAELNTGIETDALELEMDVTDKLFLDKDISIMENPAKKTVKNTIDNQIKKHTDTQNNFDNLLNDFDNFIGLNPTDPTTADSEQVNKEKEVEEEKVNEKNTQQPQPFTTSIVQEQQPNQTITEPSENIATTMFEKELNEEKLNEEKLNTASITPQVISAPQPSNELSSTTNEQIQTSTDIGFDKSDWMVRQNITIEAPPILVSTAHSDASTAIARLLAYDVDKYLAVGLSVTTELIEHPEFTIIPSCADYVYGLMEWQQQRIPLIDLNRLINRQTITELTANSDSQSQHRPSSEAIKQEVDKELEKEVKYALVLAYQTQPNAPLQHYAVALSRMPDSIIVDDSMGCPLPTDNDLWQTIAISCLKYQGNTIPIIATNKLLVAEN